MPEACLKCYRQFKSLLMISQQHARSCHICMHAVLQAMLCATTGWSISPAPRVWSHGTFRCSNLMGNWPALTPSMDPTCHFTMSPRLGFMVAYYRLGPQYPPLQPATSLTCRRNNDHSLPQSSRFRSSSHTKPRTTRATGCYSSGVMQGAILQSCSKPCSVPSRSVQGTSRVK